MTTSGKTVQRVAAAAAAVLALSGATAPPVGGAPGEAIGRALAAPLPATVLVPLRIAAPAGVDVGGDGTVYATEPATGRALAQHPDGSSEVLPFTGLDAPEAIAVAPDGTVYVGDGDRVRSLAPDGTQDELDLLLEDVTALDVDPADGSLLVADTALPQVLRVRPDGSAQAVALAGTTDFAGIAAGDAGDVLVVDLVADDVAILHPDDTRDLAGFTTLADPASVAFHDGTTWVAQPEGVVQLDAAAVESTTALPIAVPGGIAAADDGSIAVATAPAGTCRCPEGPGAVLHHDGSTTTPITFGDVASIPSVAATAPGAVIFASFQGPQGYSDPNPLRQVVGTAPATDVDTGGAEGSLVAGAPDGALYLSSGPSLVRVAPDGSTTPVDLPTEPGEDQVVALAVDEAGRLFVTLGSGYGSGAFHVVEPLADGGARTWYESGDDELLNAVGAGGATLQLAITRVAGAQQRLVRIGLDGGAPTDRPLAPAPALALAVDAAGVAYVLTAPEDGSQLLVVPASGEPTTRTYVGQRVPQRLSMGRDGTLYVVDAEVGLLALRGVGATGTPAGPAAPAPAVPVAGAADYTG